MCLLYVHVCTFSVTSNLVGGVYLSITADVQFPLLYFNNVILRLNSTVSFNMPPFKRLAISLNVRALTVGKHFISKSG